MSMKKLSKKLLAVVAAGAMTMGLAMPAFSHMLIYMLAASINQ